MRWAWFSGARALDDELSRRLGTLGYLPFEVRDKIFRLVLDEYIEEALRHRTYLDPHVHSGPSLVTWLAMLATKHQPKGEIGIWTQGNHPTYECGEDPKLYKVFYLRQKPFGPPQDFVMPLRLATPDTKFEFDRIFLSTMTFDFPCPKALQLFLGKLSAVQLSQVGSITIRIYGCDVCSGGYRERIYYKWGFLCAKLPSTLISIKFDLSDKGAGGFNPARGFILGLEDYKVAKQGLRFLRRQVERIALETEISLLKTLDPDNNMPCTDLGTCPSTVLDSLDAMVREIEDLIANAKAREERACEDIEIVRGFRIPSFAATAAWVKHSV